MNIRLICDRWAEELARDPSTKRTYRRAVEFFMAANKLPETFDVEKITHKHYIAFLVWLRKNYPNPNTQAIYAVGVNRFLGYLYLNDLSDVNLEKTRAAKKEFTIEPKPNLRQFSSDDIETVLEQAEYMVEQLFENEKAKLRAYRDRAFLLTLADTGMRVHEACELRRGQLDLNEGQAVIVGKGRKQATIRFTERSIKAIRDYFTERAILDGASGRPLASLPVFSQHAKSSGNRVKPLTTKSGRDIVDNWVIIILGDRKKGTITPHSFRHYFVTTILRVTGNLKLAKELARHSSMSVTEGYANLTSPELDKAYHEIFNRRD